MSPSPSIPAPSGSPPSPPNLAPPPRRRSTGIVLTIVGGMAAAGAVAYALSPSRDEPDMARNKYATQADCERDYSPAQCTAEPSTTTPGQRHFYGPMFFPIPMAGLRGTTDPGPGRFADRTLGTETVRRGFGSTTRGFTSTGS